MTLNLNAKIKANIKVRMREDDREFLSVLNCLAGQLEAIAAGQPIRRISKEQLMALTSEQQGIVKRFDDATTAAAKVIRDLIANPPSHAEFIARLGEMATNLELLGAPGQPLPGPGPQPTP